MVGPITASSGRVLLFAKLQGTYDVAGALWPLLAMDQFEAVTGPKHDEWLVRTVAGILLFIGALLLHDAFIRKHIDRGLRCMAGGVSLVLAIVALVSSLGGWISWLYFFDGLLHLSFAIGWLWFGLRKSKAPTPLGPRDQHRLE